MLKVLEFPAKEFRAQIIVAHLNEVVCHTGIVSFGCGNAAAAQTKNQDKRTVSYA